MSSELFVNKITGTSGTSGGAPITLSGDTATLSGTGVTQGAYLNLTSIPASQQQVVITTGVPSNAREINLMLMGVSTTNSSADIVIQLGTTSGYKTSGYVGSRGYLGTASGIEASSDGFGIKNGISANDTASSLMTLISFGSDNIWFAKNLGSYSAVSDYMSFSEGNVTLDGTLTSLRIVVATGSFDAGKIGVYVR